MAATSPAFAAVTDDDHRGILWIAAILSLIFTLLTLSARLYVRKHMLGRDDYAVVAAVVISIAQYGTVFSGMQLGLGTSDPRERHGNVPQMGRTLMASQVIFICVLYVCKFAVLFTTERLLALTMTLVRRICKAMRVLFGLCALASILTITIKCSAPSLPLGSGDRQCSNLVTRWTVVTVLDFFTELLHLAIFCSIVWSLQMRTELKTTLTALLTLRVLCPIFTAVYTSSINTFSNSSNSDVQVIAPLVWQQVATGYSMISALLTALMPFLKSFHTAGMGVEIRNATTTGGNSSNGYLRSRQIGGGASYGLDNLSKHSKHRSQGASRVGEEEEGILRPDTTGYSAVIYGANKHRNQGGDMGSGGGSSSSSRGNGPTNLKSNEISVETTQVQVFEDMPVNFSHRS